MHPKMIAKRVGTVKISIKMPVPNIPMPLVEEKDRASAVQMNMASGITIEVMQLPVLQLSLLTSLLSPGSLPP